MTRKQYDKSRCDEYTYFLGLGVFCLLVFIVLMMVLYFLVNVLGLASIGG